MKNEPVTYEELRPIVDVIADAMKSAAFEVLLDKEILVKVTNGVSEWARNSGKELFSDEETWMKANEISKELFLEKVVR